MSFDIGNFDIGSFNTVPQPIPGFEEFEEVGLPLPNPLTYIGRSLTPTERGWGLGEPYCIDFKKSGDQLESILIHGPSGTGKTFLLFLLFEALTLLTAEPIFWVDRKAEWYGWGHPKLPGHDNFEWRAMERVHSEFLSMFVAIGFRLGGSRNPTEAYIDAYTSYFTPDNVTVFFPAYAPFRKEDLEKFAQLTGYKCRLFKPSWKLLTPSATASLFNLNLNTQYMDAYERAFIEARSEAENYSDFVSTLSDFVSKERPSKDFALLVKLLAQDFCFKWFEYKGDNILLEAFDKPGQIYVLTFVGMPQVPKNAAWVEMWIDSAVMAVRSMGRPATVAIDDLPWYRIGPADITSALERLIHIESRMPGVGMRKIIAVQTPRQLPRNISPSSMCYTHIFATKPSYGFTWKAHPQYECEMTQVQLDKNYRLLLRPPLNKKLVLPRDALPLE